MDNYVFSGLKTVVQGASFDRLAAAVPGFQTSTDVQIQSYVNNFFNYERWDDHEGMDGMSGSDPFGAAGYNGGNDARWMEEYMMGTRYRVTEEIAQGSGCSSCSQGEGTFKYEYAANYNDAVLSTNNTNPGYNTIEYNVWRMKTTEYLPQDSNNWGADDREIIYSNEVGQPMLDVYVQVNPSATDSITAISAAAPQQGQNYSVVTVTANNNFSVGQYVALSGILPEMYNGVVQITAASHVSFGFDLPQTYYGDSILATKPPTPYVNTTTPAPGQVTLGDGSATLVTGQSATYFRYDDAGHLIETAQPSAVTGYNDAYENLISNSSPSFNGLSANSGLITLTPYAGWSFDGRSGITANGSPIIKNNNSNFTMSFPSGDNNVAFIEDSSYLSQTVVATASGSFTLNFQAAGAYNSTLQLQLFVDGQQQTVTFNGSQTSSMSPTDGTFESGSISLNLGTGPHTIAFMGDSSGYGYALVANVSLTGTGAPAIADGNFQSLQLASGAYQTNPSSYPIMNSSGTLPSDTVSGSIAGDQTATYVEQGQQGTPILQESFTYYAHTANGASVYPVATDTVYGNTDGTDARTTNYSYTWQGTSDLLQSETVIAPPIVAAQNGPATSNTDTADADTTTTFFDSYGNASWTKDGGGFITYSQYDPLTNGLLKQISDVNTADANDFSNKPSGWTTPTGGGLELVTSYTVDALGRPTSMLSPNEQPATAYQAAGPDNGYSTQYVYIDGDTNGYVDQVFVYPGWHSTGGGNYTTTGPVQVSREYRGGNIVTSTATGGSTNTLTDTSLSSTGWYIGLMLTITAGTDAGQTAIVTGYNSSTKQLTFAPAFAAAVDTTSQYTLSTPVYDETLTFTAPVDSSSPPTGSETISSSNIQSLSRGLTNNAGQLIEQDAYTSLSGLTYSSANAIVASASPASNTASGNYDATHDSYDSRGRLNRVVDPNGTITRTVYDGLGRVTSTYVGTDDTPASGFWSPSNNTAPSNMIDTTDYVYDNGGVGDGDLTQMTSHVGGGQPDRVTLNLYDFRDRLIATKQGALMSGGNPNPSGETDGAHRLITYFNLDNLGETVATLTYAGDGVSLTDFSNWTLTGTDPTDLRAYSANPYDDLGRVYQSQQFSVDPSSGTVGSDLVTNNVYDHRGNLIAMFAPGGQVTKYSFDGAGRVVKQSTTDGGVINGAAQPGSSGGWAAAGTTANDIVVEQTVNSHDGDGNLTESVDRQRFDTDPTTSSGEADLAGPSGGNLASRDYYSAKYFDAADRLTDSVNVGTNGGSAWTRPASVPSDSDTVLVTHTNYDNGGRVLDTIDPRGIKAGNFYDLLGRTLDTIGNWDGTGSAGSLPTAGNSTNQITNYAYDGNGDVLSMTAMQPTGGATPNQTTAYVYGVGGTIGTNLFSNDLVAQVDYPDKSTGQAATVASEQQSFGYNFQRNKTSFTDQNGTTHGYNYDVLDRLTADIVSTLGSGVDGSILRLGYSYNDAGLAYQQTSYSDTGGSTVVNQVQDVYNGYGQLVTQYQEHSGAVNTGSSLKVQYTYSQPTGSNFSRMTAMIYPNGRQLDYIYNTGLDSAISRVSGLSDDSGTGAGNDQSYTYLGLNTIVQALDGNGIELTYVKQTGESNGDAGDKYIGLDRFGRVDDQRWIPVSNPNSPTDRFQYAYDQDGNVLYKNNLVNSSFSELYHANSTSSGDDNSAYDNLNRIVAFRRGTLSASGNNGSTLDTVSTLNTNADSSQSWTLDALGNQSSVTTDGTPTGRTLDAQNQITAVASADLAYDNNGNTTTNENGYTLIYDAWNRLVQVKNGSTVLASYKYDAAGNRIQQTESSATTNLYYSTKGQVLEERQAGTVFDQNVWGLMYVNQLVVRDDNSISGSYGISGSGLGRRIYVQQDANWNASALVSGSGTVLQREDYTPYGIQTTLSASWATTTDAYGVAYGFQGGRLDDVTGLVHFSDGDFGRDYDAYLGTWTEQDPAGYLNSANLYEYVGSNPEVHGDPSGHGFDRPGGPSYPHGGEEKPGPDPDYGYGINPGYDPTRGLHRDPSWVTNTRVVCSLGGQLATLPISGPYGVATRIGMSIYTYGISKGWW